jgi:hypothetical protein
MSNPPPASAAAGGTAATAADRHLSKLPAFWSASPTAWFRVIEGQFALHGVTDPIERYYLVINALSETNMDRPQDCGGGSDSWFVQTDSWRCCGYSCHMCFIHSILISSWLAFVSNCHQNFFWDKFQNKTYLFWFYFYIHSCKKHIFKKMQNLSYMAEFYCKICRHLVLGQQFWSALSK